MKPEDSCIAKITRCVRRVAPLAAVVLIASSCSRSLQTTCPDDGPNASPAPLLPPMATCGRSPSERGQP
jgi:hypothetical protein